MALTQVSTKGIKDGTILNEDINASASIAGTKISPDFGSQTISTTANVNCKDITLTDTTPGISFVDSNNNSDFRIIADNGVLSFADTTNNANRINIQSDGHVDVVGNLDVGAGIDVTGNITATGTSTITGGLIEVQGTQPVIKLTDTDNNDDFSIINNHGTYLIYDATDGAYRFEIDSSGNCGIGTTGSVSYKLDVIGDGGGAFSASSNSTQGQLSIVGKNSGGSVSAISRIKSYPDGSSNQSHLAFETRNSSNNMVEAMRITSNQKIGIGLTSPSGRLHLYEASNDPYIYIQRGSGDTAATLGGIFWKNSTNSLGLIDVRSDDINDGRMRFYTMGAGTLTERVRLESGGNLKILDGDLVIGASGHGIDFSDTSDAGGMTSELLDDYEEGTWTPSVTGGTIVNSGAYYTKIGRVVHWYLYGYVSNTANDGNQFRIYGLPFQVGGNSQGLQNYYGNAATFNYTASANNSGLGVLTPLAHGAQTYLYFHFIGIGDPNPPVNSYWHSHMLNQSFIISGTYFT